MSLSSLSQIYLEGNAVANAWLVHDLCIIHGCGCLGGDGEENSNGSRQLQAAGRAMTCTSYFICLISMMALNCDSTNCIRRSRREGDKIILCVVVVAVKVETKHVAFTCLEGQLLRNNQAAGLRKLKTTHDTGF
jgi:hypothetical protein